MCNPPHVRPSILTTAHRPPSTAHRPPTIVHRPPAAGHYLPSTGHIFRQRIFCQKGIFRRDRSLVKLETGAKIMVFPANIFPIFQYTMASPLNGGLIVVHSWGSKITRVNWAPHIIISHLEIDFHTCVCFPSWLLILECQWKLSKSSTFYC